ncbi:unnamed protein product [Effrenium voratum]|nr:unnamed protein product [Effrenium voratum]
MASTSSDVVILNYADLVEGKDLSAEIAKAYGPGGLGICGVKGVPGLQERRGRSFCPSPTSCRSWVSRPSPATSNWCGWHNDNSVITGLVPALWLYEDTGEEAPASAVSGSGGLYIQGRDRSVIRVSLPPDCLGFQIGEASQILSGGVLVATPHQVRPLAGKQERPICRETFALFIEPQWDAPIGPPEGVGYDSVLKEEESELIPPLSKRLKITKDAAPVIFGEYLGDSFKDCTTISTTDALEGEVLPSAVIE